MKDRELAALLDADGRHLPEGLERRENGYWYAHCKCGYISARRMSAQEAGGALIHHMRKVGRELLANGVSLGNQRVSR